MPYYEEIEGSQTLQVGRDNSSGRRIFKINWDQIDEFVDALLPTEVSQSQSQYDSFPGYPRLKASNLSFEPWGRPIGDSINTPLVYDFAKVTVDYKPPDARDGGADNDKTGPGGENGSNKNAPGSEPAEAAEKEDAPQEQTKEPSFPRISHKVTVGGEFLMLPNRTTRWDKSPSGDPYSPGSEHAKDYYVSEEVQTGIVIPTIEHSITWEQVICPYWAYIRYAVGCVNSKTFAGAPAENLLFLGAEAGRDFSLKEGTKGWTLTYKFSEKGNGGWNFFYRPETGRFERLVRKDAEDSPIYLSADFEPLFLILTAIV